MAEWKLVLHLNKENTKIIPKYLKKLNYKIKLKEMMTINLL